MPQWFLPYTAAALVAAALGWLALNYDPDAGSQTATPTLATAPAPAAPGTQPAPAAAPGNGAPAPAAASSSAAGQAPSASPGEATVRRLVATAMTTDNASDCTRLYTQAFLEQIAGEVGAEAVDDCRDNSDGDPDSESVQFRDVQAVGAAYRVAVTLVGGEMGGTNFTLMVAREGTWKIDRLLDVDVNMGRLAAAAADEAQEEGATATNAQCLESKLAALDPSGYERAIIEGRSDEYAKQLFSSSLNCLSAETLRKQLADGIRSGAAGAPEVLIECVIDKILEGKSVAELRALIQMDHAAGVELGRRAAAECAQMMSAVS